MDRVQGWRRCKQWISARRAATPVAVARPKTVPLDRARVNNRPANCLHRMVQRRMRSDRGVVLVEAALIMPFVALLALGIIEWGFVWQDDHTLESASRAGARTGASACITSLDPSCDLGNDLGDDYSILQAVGAALANVPSSHIRHIVIYRADSADGPPSAACAAGTGSGEPTPCNVYTASDLTRPASDFGCLNPGQLDSNWCPDNRVRGNNAADYLGVYVEIDHDYLTGIFGTSRVIADQTVFRLEPNPFAADATTTTSSTTTTLAPTTTTTRAGGGGTTTTGAGGTTTTALTTTTTRPTTTTTRPTTTTTRLTTTTTRSTSSTVPTTSTTRVTTTTTRPATTTTRATTTTTRATTTTLATTTTRVVTTTTTRVVTTAPTTAPTSSTTTTIVCC